MPIDQLSKADLPALRRLAQACLDADGGLPLLTETAMLRSRFLREQTVAIREDGELLAAAGLDVDGDRATTSGMVAPRVRGQRLGTHLLTWAEDARGTGGADRGYRVLRPRRRASLRAARAGVHLRRDRRPPRPPARYRAWGRRWASAWFR